MAIEWCSEFETGLKSVDIMRVNFKNIINEFENSLICDDHNELQFNFSVLMSHLETFFDQENNLYARNSVELHPDFLSVQKQCKLRMEEYYSLLRLGEFNAAKTASDFISLWYYTYLCYPQGTAFSKDRNQTK